MTNKDHIERTKRMIEVMQAYVDGEAVEYQFFDGNWYVNPIGWCSLINYRIAKTPDQINWDHVAPDFKYMARGENGRAHLYSSKPDIYPFGWMSADINRTTCTFASYKRGTVDWKDSLVIRPGCE